MDKENGDLKLLLVDDEEDFRRATSAALSRRGFAVTEAASGEEALDVVQHLRPDVVILDLKMPGLDGIETLQRLRRKHPTLPVIILTGHGDFDSALAGIELEIVDFLQKPVDIDRLGRHIRRLLEEGVEESLRERTVAELMVRPSLYPRLYADQPVSDAIATLREASYQPVTRGAQAGQVRSALVYDRNEIFLGLIRFADILKLVLPSFLQNSPYTTFFTGMFLAQCKVSGNRDIRELMNRLVFIDVYAPLMEAVHLMVRHHLMNLAVLDKGELVGILRGRDIILEIANVMEF